MIKVIGWQSWSPVISTRNKIPIRNYSPFKNKETSSIINPKNKLKRAPLGWCSWHAFGTNINSKIIINHACWIAKNRKSIPLDYVLIDDGWTKMGDWLTSSKQKFPDGMKKVAMRIKKLGLKPGIWIAPFLVQADSLLAKNHPEWLISNKKGKLLEGTRISPFDNLFLRKRWVLNLQIKKVNEYLFNIFDVIISDWGFELIKLDFLYAQHFNPFYSNSKIPDNLLSEFLLLIS